MHTPVLLEQALEALEIKEGGLYIDATLGEGGHFREMIARGGKVLGIDWDPVQIKRLQNEFQGNPNALFTTGNYAEIEKLAKQQGHHPVDGVLFDLGLSMEQIKSGGRGFSYKSLGDPLDMRINSRIKTAASDIVNYVEYEKLSDIFASYGEEVYSPQIAQKIVAERKSRKIRTVGDLIHLIDAALRHKNITDTFAKEKVYLRIFQALRIVVNNEFENIKKGLRGGLRLLKSGGRIAIITFHSREDRIVKQLIREYGLKTLQKKVVEGSYELRFERSAKLRTIIKE